MPCLILGSKNEMDRLDMFIKVEYTLSFGVQSEPVSKKHPVAQNRTLFLLLQCLNELRDPLAKVLHELEWNDHVASE